MISRFAELRLLQLSLKEVGPFRDETRKFRVHGVSWPGRGREAER